MRMPVVGGQNGRLISGSVFHSEQVISRLGTSNRVSAFCRAGQLCHPGNLAADTSAPPHDLETQP
jgi:hypothetical protein